MTVDIGMRLTIGDTPHDDVVETLVSRIFSRNDLLYEIYLLHNRPFDGGDRASTRSKIAFLLWYAVFGRHRYEAICLIDDAYMALLRTPLAAQATLLDQYLADLEGGREHAQDPATARHVAAAGSLFGQPWFARPVAADTGPGPHGLTGISIVGLPLSTVGIGEDVRSLFKVVRSLDIPVNLVDVEPRQLERIKEASDYESFISRQPVFPTVIFCMPLFEYIRLTARWGPQSLANRYCIGYFAWELTEIDPCWSKALRRIDEIWSSSQFTYDVFRKTRPVGVHHVPMLVDVGSPDLSIRDRLSLPPGFSALVFIDFTSTAKRKNALGAVTAFKQAFGPGSTGAFLIIKTMHADLYAAAWEELKQVIDGDERIIVVDGPLSRAEILGLIASSDVLLSLHRAEGFGRVLAEAMALGTIVVATDWSGSRDILRPGTGYLIRYDLVPLETADYPEAAGVWAEPDIGHAAEVLRHLRTDPEERTRVAQEARQHVARSFHLAPVRGGVARRLHQIDAERSRSQPA